MKTTPVNYDMPTVVAQALQEERGNGPSMIKTVCAALHWYLHHLDSTQREQARQETKKWIETGLIPQSTIADDAEEALRAARVQESKLSNRKF